jgi:uncharacterized protein YggT (Ycf19 family)
MNQPPNHTQPPHGDPERRQLNAQEREAQRLRQEEARLRTAKRKQVFTWIRNTIILLVGSLEILLALRLFLRLSRANPDNTFAQVIYTLSEPFVAPFSTLFISPTNADATRIFDLNLIFAMIIYALLGALGIALLNYFQGRNPYGR